MNQQATVATTHIKRAKKFRKWWWLLIPVTGIVTYIINTYPHSYFRNPLDISLQLAANFGDLREDHFHMGLDIRTNGKEDLPVYAAADGYISRVQIEEAGFGKAIFITHPNGYTTVYAHLNKFYVPLENFVHKKQYRDKSWQQDVSFAPAMFPVKKGQRIAGSGNTGASEGPHLHFEIRETKTGNNLNPEFYGYDVNDHIAPVMHSLWWYDRRYSTYQHGAHKIDIAGWNGQYNSTSKIVKVNSPMISLGLTAEDRYSNSSFRFGIYSAAVWMDDSLIYSFALDSFSYTDTRYINACIDYTHLSSTGKWIQHLSVLPGNHMHIFKNTASNGIIRLQDGLPHTIRIWLSDANKNISALVCLLQYEPLSVVTNTVYIPAAWLLPGKENYLSSDHSQLHFNRFSFYDAAPLALHETTNTGGNKASPLIILSNTNIPVHDSFIVRLKTTLAPNDPLRNKTVMQCISRNGTTSIKGKWKGDWMAARFNRLGNLQLLVDTIPPIIQLQEWKYGATFSVSAETLKLICKDNIGPLSAFRAILDGKWILFSQKGNLFTYSFDEHCPPGKHRLTITITDIAGNSNRNSFDFIKK